MQLHVTTYFTNFFKARNAKKAPSTNKRIKPAYYGEALTRDEIVQRIEAEEEEKREKEAKKRGRKRKRAEQATSVAGKYRK